MLIPDRRRRILDHVRRHGSASIEQLAATLGVSTSTVRRDMDQLEGEGLLARARGGAIVTTQGSPAVGEPDLPADAAADAKARIGSLAASLVADDSTIMVLAGSTTGAMIPLLYHRRLTVVTNGLEIAFALRHAPGVAVVVLGGYLHREQMTLLGPMTATAMGALHVDALFAGAWGVAADTGVTGNKIIQAGNHEEMLRHADRLVVLADATKIGRRGPTLLAGIDQLDTLVTSTGAPADQLDQLAARGADVQVAR